MDLSAALPVLAPVPGGGDPAALAGQANSRDPRSIDNVATGFESLFASLLVKSMRESLGPDSMFGGDRSEVLGGLFDYFMGQHLAPQGALGIGAMVKKQLQARGTS
jgi:peptidoglycan hydrolase FlgJ